MHHWIALISSFNLVYSMCLYVNPIDPKGLPSNMRYFPRTSPNSLKIPLKFRANTQIQSLTNAYLLIKNEMISFAFDVEFHGV